MVNQQIEKLLILQDREHVVRRLNEQLESIPRAIQAHEAEIETEKQALQDSKSKLQSLEIQRNDLDTQVGAAQDQVGKYKNQQLQVKKNEEYQALTHEIEILEKKISDWEEEEIGLMLAIDSEAEEYSKRESVFDSTLSKIQAHIDKLDSKIGEVREQIKGAEGEFSDAKSHVEDSYFTPYDRLASRMKLPVIVTVEQQKCNGCHLRVSNETSELARKGEELTTCDNCGRIVFLAS
jgi:predicted  nucleic acid-binding Zn-ribbon protein